MIDLNKILREFQIESTIENYGNGHINDTYLTDPDKYILQRINTKIFKNHVELMDNINNVTSFLREKIVKEGGDPDRETLTVVKTKDGKNYYEYDSENVFRVYKFITGTKTIEQSTSADDMYYAGKGFGRFAGMLNDYPADKLYETIVDFHNTPKRVEALKKAISDDIAKRASSVQPEIEFALKNAEFAGKVVEAMASGEIPLRVTHNDTKINNILFDEKTSEAVCVIDLDTVMPGSALYDFGDALRIGASTAAEDETDLSKVQFSKEYFKGFAKGYFEEMKEYLTDKEIELLPFSAKLLTYECGIRFLTDYLNGDTYFKTHYEQHNLDRARNQFKLVSDIANLEDELNKIVAEL
ncbi:MAG: aminoglycoside phosphotransferase family protein [Clostridia bacterium]|nr:aminoglycoside phosphotransferase family protein [Clostridia bacterium]